MREFMRVFLSNTQANSLICQLSYEKGNAHTYTQAAIRMLNLDSVTSPITTRKRISLLTLARADKQ